MFCCWFGKYHTWSHVQKLFHPQWQQQQQQPLGSLYDPVSLWQQVRTPTILMIAPRLETVISRSLASNLFWNFSTLPFSLFLAYPGLGSLSVQCTLTLYTAQQRNNTLSIPWKAEVAFNLILCCLIPLQSLGQVWYVFITECVNGLLVFLGLGCTDSTPYKYIFPCFVLCGLLFVSSSQWKSIIDFYTTTNFVQNLQQGIIFIKTWLTSQWYLFEKGVPLNSKVIGPSFFNKILSSWVIP